MTWEDIKKADLDNVSDDCLVLAASRRAPWQLWSISDHRNYGSGTEDIFEPLQNVFNCDGSSLPWTNPMLVHWWWLKYAAQVARDQRLESTGFSSVGKGKADVKRTYAYAMVEIARQCVEDKAAEPVTVPEQSVDTQPTEAPLAGTSTAMVLDAWCKKCSTLVDVKFK
jgi:hypothetical protein